MTSTALTHMPSMGYERPKPSFAASCPPATLVVRHRSGLVQVVIALSWIVGITGSFLTVGVIGMFAADLPPIHLKTLEDLDESTDLPLMETSMAELQAMGESAEQSTEPEPVLPVEIPETIETPPENLDLPEIAEAMTMEDIFAIPTAPKIENALRPIDPVIKRVTTPQRPRPGPVAKSSGTGSNSTQSGAAGGTGTANGSGKGRFPKPPYPGFASSAGMQGTVRLTISVGPSGAVESVIVSGTSGFNALDEYSANWVRRNYRWPASGSAQRYVLPLRYQQN